MQLRLRVRGRRQHRIAVRGDKKIDRINKKIGKSMARQEKRGIRKADREALTYGGKVKTSGMRKKAKKNRSSVNPATGKIKLPNTKRL